MLYSCLVDADFLDTETFMAGVAAPRGGYDDIPTLFQKLTQYIAPWMSPKNSLNQKRCAILQCCLSAGRKDCLWSLFSHCTYWRWKNHLITGIRPSPCSKAQQITVIYVIPYISIIDQTAQVFRQVLGEGKCSGTPFRSRPLCYRRLPFPGPLSPDFGC